MGVEDQGEEAALPMALLVVPCSRQPAVSITLELPAANQAKDG